MKNNRIVHSDTQTGNKRDRRGFALVAVLMIAMVGAVLALASAMMAMSNVFVQSGSDRTSAVDDAAISALEIERSRLNARLDSVPISGYLTIENNLPVAGTNIRRSIWIARLGNADSLSAVGEFGVQAEVVVKAVDVFGNVAIRRSQLFQESFARYASFTDQGKMADGQTLYWALGAQAQGPVHSNDTLFVWAANPQPQAVFNDKVTTAKIVKNKTYAQFRKGPPGERVSPIPMPTAGDLNLLKSIAAKAGYVFTPDVVTGDSALATMRIEFVAIDVDGDGKNTGPDEGYFKVYQLKPTLDYGAGYTLARTPAPIAGAPAPKHLLVSDDSLIYSHNCGVTSIVGGRTAINKTFAAIPFDTSEKKYEDQVINKWDAWDNANARCFLGGDDRLSPTGQFRAVDSAGYWMPRAAGSVPAAVAARADGAYLWPLAPALNPNFRGVIFAEGKVAVSGVVRGRLTLASRNNLVIAEEIMQATSPGVTSGTCKPDDDVVGLFSGEYILYADNSIATPQQRRDKKDGDKWQARKEFDSSPRRPDLTVHASVLALKSVATENAIIPGQPASSFVTRGYTRLIGGTIEARAGVTGSMSGSKLHGYYDDLSFNRCLLQYPPPYFPTTGRWSRSQYYEVNPQGFTPASWFAR